MAGNAARAGAMTAMGVGYGATRAAGMGLKMLGGGLRWNQAKLPFTSRTLPIPELNFRAKAALAIGATAYGVGAGAYDVWNKKRWNLSYALATGQVEAEREDFLGATGSLTLASYQNGRGGGALSMMGGGRQMVRHALTHHSDDLLLAMTHAF
jgi:hypothetical protein